MSHAYDARFAPVSLDLADVMDRLERALPQTQLSFDGEAVALRSQGGLAIVAEMNTHSAANLAEVARVARRWWGVSLYCTSESLAEELGRSEAMEVYLRAVKWDPEQRLVIYNESSSAFRARAESDKLTRKLAATLVTLCAALGSPLAVYAEEDPDLGEPTLAEVIQRLTTQAEAAAPSGWLAVARIDQLALEQARDLAAGWRDRVGLAPKGYVVLPFLSDSAI